MRSTNFPLTAFLYELLQNHVHPGDLEELVTRSEVVSPEKMLELSNGYLVDYAEDLSRRLTTSLLQQVEAETQTLRHVSYLQDKALDTLRGELQNEREKLRNEREVLSQWLESRIQQQEQLLAPSIGAETRQLAEIEIGMLRRYREYVLSGAHRPRPDLIGSWGEG